MKTLDEAIKHCEEKAKELSNKAYAEWGMSMSEEEAYKCHECAFEHDQLAKWLQNYADISKAVKRWQNRELSAIETLKMIVPFIEQQTGGKE